MKNLLRKLYPDHLFRTGTGIINNSFFGIAFQVTNLFSSLIIISFIAHNFGSTVFGQYSLSTSLAGTLALALGTAVNIPIYRTIARGKKSIVNYFVNGLLIKSIGLLILLPIAILILSYFITPYYQKILLLCTLFVGFNGIIGYYQGVLITKGLNNYNFLINLGSKLLQLLAAYYIKQDFTHLLIAFNIIILINFLIYHYVTPREISGILKNYPNYFNLRLIKKLILVSLPLIFISFSEFVTLKFDQIILGIIRTEQEVGLYAAAVNIVLAYSLISLAVTQVFFPNYIQKLVRSSGEARKYFFLVVKVFLAFSLIMVVTTFILSDFIILTVYGKEFMPASEALIILSLSLFFITVNRLTSTAINAHGKYIYTLKITITGMVINLVLNFLFIPTYGFIGASVVTIISEGIVAILGYISVLKLLRIKDSIK